MTSYSPPLVAAPGAGEVIEVGGVEHLFELTGDQTAGRLAIEEFSLAAGAMGARPHVHGAHDEYFYVTSGELTIHDGTGEQVVAAGSLVAALRGSAHGFRNARDAVKVTTRGGGGEPQPVKGLAETTVTLIVLPVGVS